MSYAILTCQPAKFVAYLIFKEFLADIKLSEMISALSNFENMWPEKLAKHSTIAS